MTAPTLPLAELRARYDALGKLEDIPFERTFISRCLTFDDFVKFGAKVAGDFVRLASAWGDEEVADIRELHPGLFDLIREAWPSAQPRE